MPNLTAKAKNVVRFYNKRGNCEQWIKEGKRTLTWTRLSCTRFSSNQVRLALFVLAYNMGNFMRRFALSSKVSHWNDKRRTPQVHSRLYDKTTSEGGAR